jgi:membrane protease YdiL (CAAX protease family)
VIAGEVGLLLLGWGLSRWLHIPLVDQLHFSFRDILLGLLAALPLLAGLLWTLRTPSKPIKHLIQVVQDQLGPLVASRSAGELALVAALAGLAEEVLFRGVMQGELARRLPGFIALILTSVAFGLAHFLTFSYALLAALGGLYLGGLYWAQGNLVIPIVAHAVYDLVALVQLARMYRARTIPD